MDFDDFEDFITGVAEQSSRAPSIYSRSPREFDLGWSPRNSRGSQQSRNRTKLSDFEVDQAIDDLLFETSGPRNVPTWDDTRLLSSRSLDNRAKPQRKPLSTRSLRPGGVSWGPTVVEPIRPESIPGMRPTSPRKSSLLSFVDKLPESKRCKKSPRKSGAIVTELPHTKTACKSLLKDDLVALARQYGFNVYKSDGKTLKTKEQLCQDLVGANKGIQRGNPTKEVKRDSTLPRTKTECREILKDDLVELARKYGVATDRPDPKKPGKRIPRTKPDICNDLLNLGPSSPRRRTPTTTKSKHKFVPRQSRPPSPRYEPRNRRARRPSSARTSGF